MPPLLPQAVFGNSEIPSEVQACLHGTALESMKPEPHGHPFPSSGVHHRTRHGVFDLSCSF